MPQEIYIVILVYLVTQLPFTFINLFLAITQPHSVCMDKPQYLTIFILRPWFLGVGIAESVCLAGVLLPLLIFKLKCIKVSELQ